jgi:hypothetical protein
MQPDISQYAAVSASSLFAVYVLVSFVKPLIEAGLSTAHPLHDWAIRLSACVFGVLVVVVATAITGPLDGPRAFVAITQGVMAGLGAVGAYHLLNTDGSPPAPPPAAPPAVVVPAPPAPPASTIVMP